MKNLWILLRYGDAGTYDEKSLDLIAQELTDWEGNEQEISQWIEKFKNQNIGELVHYGRFSLIKVYDVSS